MTRTAARPRTPQQRAFSTPQSAYRSGLEEKIADQLRRSGVPVMFERFKLPYIIPASKHTYCPDFLLPNGIVVETKGYLQTADKQKMKLVKAQHPDVEIRFCFSNANARMSKQSKTTYGMWATANGFKWSHKEIPEEWLKEARNEDSIAALDRMGFWPKTSS